MTKQPIRDGQVWRRRRDGQEVVVCSTADLKTSLSNPGVLIRGKRFSSPLVSTFQRDYEFVREESNG